MHKKYKENYTTWHTIVKLLKIKDENILKAAWGERHVTYRGMKIMMKANLSLKTMQMKR